MTSSRLSVFLLATMVLCFSLRVDSFAGDEDLRLTRLEWQILRDEILVTYDLEGEPEEDYIVSMTLLRESDKVFRFKPIFVTGKIGEGQFAGTGNQIRWAYKTDIPEVFPGDDYYIELQVSRPSSFPWLIAAGGTAIAGIVIALATIQKSPVAEVPTVQLPFPPPRP